MVQGEDVVVVVSSSEGGYGSGNMQRIKRCCIHGVWTITICLLSWLKVRDLGWDETVTIGSIDLEI